MIQEVKISHLFTPLVPRIKGVTHDGDINALHGTEARSGTVRKILVPVRVILKLPATAPLVVILSVVDAPLVNVLSPLLIRVPFCVALQWYVLATPEWLVNITGTGSPAKIPAATREGVEIASELYEVGEKLPLA